jgi:carboxymethylenebutenolidase
VRRDLSIQCQVDPKTQSSFHFAGHHHGTRADHVIVYDVDLDFEAEEISSALLNTCGITFTVSFTNSVARFGAVSEMKNTAPFMIHASEKLEKGAADVVYTYNASSPSFVLPSHAHYQHGAAALAHTRTLTFLKKYLDFPNFDLEAIWDEHTLFEFGERDVAKTMGTMVDEPYVNHVPTV